MASLYELSLEFLQLSQQLEEMDLDQQLISDTLESAQMPIEQKAENIIKFAKNLEAMAEARKAEAKRLTEQAAKDAKKAEGLLKYLDDTMQMLGKKELTAGIFEVKYKKGSEVVKIEEFLLPSFEENPAIYEEQKPKLLDKPKLKAMLKSYGGIKIPGVEIVRNPDKLVIK